VSSASDYARVGDHVAIKVQSSQSRHGGELLQAVVGDSGGG